MARIRQHRRTLKLLDAAARGTLPTRLACGSGFMARSAQKDLNKLLNSEEKIDAEMAKRGLSAW